MDGDLCCIMIPTRITSVIRYVKIQHCVILSIIMLVVIVQNTVVLMLCVVKCR